jgi:hypothetical protein
LTGRNQPTTGHQILPRVSVAASPPLDPQSAALIDN